jgi:hypothetical protein
MFTLNFNHFHFILHSNPAKSHRFFKEIIRSNTPHTRKIYEAVQRNPVLITATVEEAFDVVDRGGFIFPTQEDSHAMFVSTERCNYFYSADGKLVFAGFGACG